MQYGLYEIIRMVPSLLITKLIHSPARLIRYPFFMRNKKHIKLNSGFTTGYNCRLEVYTNENSHGQIIFGKNCKMGDYNHIVSAGNVTIGDNVLIASKVFISDCSHGDYKCGIKVEGPQEISPDERTIIARDVKIGNNVWIGDNAVILSGVEIGNGCIIGASSVVTKSIDDNTIVSGIPARILKRYNEKTFEWEKYDEIK